MLGKSLQTRDRPETLFRVYGCARKCRPGHSGFLRLEDVACVAPSIKVKILHLSTPPVHAGGAAACPCGRTLRSWSDVFPCGTAVRAGGHVYLSWLYPPYGHVCDDRLRFDPLDRSMSVSWVSPELRIDAPPAVPYF